MIRTLPLLAALLLPIGTIGCGGDAIYEPCDEPDDCTDIPESATAACIDKAGDGFCTWKCLEDADCTWDDEDDASDERVCASFESTDDLYCFPRCDDDESACPDGMVCRSTGGGDENRKICFPDIE